MQDTHRNHLIRAKSDLTTLFCIDQKPRFSSQNFKHPSGWWRQSVFRKAFAGTCWTAAAGKRRVRCYQQHGDTRAGKPCTVLAVRPPQLLLLVSLVPPDSLRPGTRQTPQEYCPLLVRACSMPVIRWHKTRLGRDDKRAGSVYLQAVCGKLPIWPHGFSPSLCPTTPIWYGAFKHHSEIQPR